MKKRWPKQLVTIIVAAPTSTPPISAVSAATPCARASRPLTTATAQYMAEPTALTIRNLAVSAGASVPPSRWQTQARLERARFISFSSVPSGPSVYCPAIMPTPQEPGFVMRLEEERTKTMVVKRAFAAALFGIGLLVAGQSSRAADTEAQLKEIQASALAEERKHPVAAERFERLWNKLLWLGGCRAGLGRGSFDLLLADAAQRADDDLRSLIAWARVQGLSNWSEMSAAGTWITEGGNNTSGTKSEAWNRAACARAANELHAGVLALEVTP